MKAIPAILFALFTSATLSAADVSGDWEFAAKILNDMNYSRVTLTADGEKLSGNLNENKLEGVVHELVFDRFQILLVESLAAVRHRERAEDFNDAGLSGQIRRTFSRKQTRHKLSSVLGQFEERLI